MNEHLDVKVVRVRRFYFTYLYVYLEQQGDTLYNQPNTKLDSFFSFDLTMEKMKRDQLFAAFMCNFLSFGKFTFRFRTLNKFKHIRLGATIYLGIKRLNTFALFGAVISINCLHSTKISVVSCSIVCCSYLYIHQCNKLTKGRIYSLMVIV